MRLLSKIGLVLVIVSMGIISIEPDTTFYAPLIMFFFGGVLYLLFDSEDK